MKPAAQPHTLTSVAGDRIWGSGLLLRSVAGAASIVAGILALFLVGIAPAPALLLAATCAAGGFFALAGLAEDEGRLAVVLTPALFAVLILFLWEVLTRGFDVPMILLPPPSIIGAAFWEMLPELFQDVRQTWPGPPWTARHSCNRGCCH
jgi:NitT/TauT family transport system permease protein